MKSDRDERRMEVLRERIERSRVPRSRAGESLTIATWNIREFGRRPRRPESLRYIAEVLRRFGLVSIVEAREDLRELELVRSMMGPSWKALFTAPMLDPGGNRERAVYLYDERVVVHSGLACQAQAPRTKRGSEYLSKVSWWRPPFLASFRAGDAELLLLTAHVRWGASARARMSELRLLANWVALEVANDPYARERDVIVLGDFNIPSVESPLYEAITSRGLRIVDALMGEHGTNLARNKRYDQILELPGEGRGGRFTGRAGVVDFYSGAGGIRGLYPSSVSGREFTYEMSDHLPLWAELRLH